MEIKSKFHLTKIILGICAGIALILFPHFSSEYGIHIAIISLFYILMSSSWNLIAGYTGQISFAHAAFAAVGAYASGLLTLRLGLPVPISILLGSSFAGFLGFLLGSLCLPIGGTYLSLVTLSFAEILRIIITNEDQWTRGTMGLQVPGFFQEYSKIHYYFLFLFVTLSVLFALRSLIRSDMGLKFRAVMDDEIAAASVGVRTTQIRILAFTVSSAIAGLAGALYGHYLMLISPDMGSLSEMFLVLAMTMIGGIGTLSGPMIGAVLLEVLSEQIRGFGEYHILIFGIIALLIVRFAPKGIAGWKRGLR